MGPGENKWHLTGLMLCCRFHNSMTGTIKAPTCEIVCDWTALLAVTINGLGKKKTYKKHLRKKKRHGWRLALMSCQQPGSNTTLWERAERINPDSARLREMLADWQKSFCACVCSDLHKPLPGVIIQNRLFAIDMNLFFFSDTSDSAFWDILR